MNRLCYSVRYNPKCILSWKAGCADTPCHTDTHTDTPTDTETATPNSPSFSDELEPRRALAGRDPPYKSSRELRTLPPPPDSATRAAGNSKETTQTRNAARNKTKNKQQISVKINRKIRFSRACTKTANRFYEFFLRVFFVFHESRTGWEA